MEEIAHVTLLASKTDVYSMFVFQKVKTGDLIMCTKLPNWSFPNLIVGDKGYIKYKKVKAGEKYFNPATETFEVYKYTNIYLTNFVRETDIIKNENTIINL